MSQRSIYVCDSVFAQLRSRYEQYRKENFPKTDPDFQILLERLAALPGIVPVYWDFTQLKFYVQCAFNVQGQATLLRLYSLISTQLLEQAQRSAQGSQFVEQRLRAQLGPGEPDYEHVEVDETIVYTKTQVNPGCFSLVLSPCDVALWGAQGQKEEIGFDGMSLSVVDSFDRVVRYSFFKLFEQCVKSLASEFQQEQDDEQD